MINLNSIKDIALEAGKAVLKIYNEDFEVEYKDDNSPLTKADKLANSIICKRLHKLYPDIPILSEENRFVEYEIRKDWECYWCVDPIDGTKEFIKKNGEFTINIALIEKNIPILGVVYAPVLDEMYSSQKGCGAFKNGVPLPLKQDRKSYNVVVSRSHLSSDTQSFIDNLDKDNIMQVSKGSSLKICMVADGSADIYPRMSPTMEWDTAAADAIARESGKMIYQFKTNKPLMYNKKNLLNPWFVLK